MSPVHHALTRSALLMISIWASGGFFFLSYFGFRWEHRHEDLVARLGSQVAHFLLARDSQGPLEIQLAGDKKTGFRQSQSNPLEGQLRISDPSGRPVRSGARIAFEHPSEPGLVSVVIPTHNRAHIIHHAIESALGQTFPRVQVIVADDGSSDNTSEVAHSYGSRVTYARQSNLGVSAARNFGMRQARGEFIAFLDAAATWDECQVSCIFTSRV